MYSILCMCVCMYVCVCKYVCMYVCICTYLCIYVCMYVCFVPSTAVRLSLLISPRDTHSLMKHLANAFSWRLCLKLQHLVSFKPI